MIIEQRKNGSKFYMILSLDCGLQVCFRLSVIFHFVDVTLHIQGTIGGDFLEQGLDIGMREQEGVEILEGVKPMAEVISVTGQSLEIGMVTGVDFKIVEVMDTVGTIRWGITVGVQTVLVV